MHLIPKGTDLPAEKQWRKGSVVSPSNCALDSTHDADQTEAARMRVWRHFISG